MKSTKTDPRPNPVKRKKLTSTAKEEVSCETRKRMRAKGLDFDYLLDRTKYLCEATKPISCIKGKEADGGTVDFVDVPDNQAIAKGLDIALTLGDYYPDKKIGVKVEGVEDILKAIHDKRGNR